MRGAACKWGLPAAFALAALLVVPGAADAFEAPRRLVWCALAVALAAAAAIGAKRRGQKAAAPSFLLPGCALLAWMVLRSLAVAPFWRAIQPLAAWTLPPVLALASASIEWTAAARRNAFRAIVAIAIAEAVLMLLQRTGLDPIFGDVTSAFGYPPKRMVGTVGYHNQAAEFLGVALFCVPAATSNRNLRLVLYAILAATIALTANRGAIIAMAAVAAFSMPTSGSGEARRAGWRTRLLFIPLLLLLILAIPAARTRIAELSTPSKSVAIQSRIWMDRVAISLLRDHPLLGGGAGSFAYEYIDRLGAMLPARKEHSILQSLVWARETHCDPLQFAAEFGVVGVALLAVFLVALKRGTGWRDSVRAACGGDVAPPIRAAAFLTICSLFSFSWQTSLAAPAAALLLGISASGGRSPVRADVRAAAPFKALPALLIPFAMLAMFAAVAENAINLDEEDAPWDAISGEPPPLLHGRWLADAAGFAMSNRTAARAAELAAMASDEWLSPALLATEAQALEAIGLKEHALAVWLRLSRCGLLHDEALRGLSLCLERLGRRDEAAAVERERFRLWNRHFTNAELYRLCALSLVAGDAEFSAWATRTIYRKCLRHGTLETDWTPEWANLRGSALLSLGHYDEARPFFEDALRRKPSLTSARRNLESIWKTRWQ